MKKKLNKLHLKRRNQKGQISIFFSTTIFVLITFMAFIINIGIFVKAKINLQNATDAAAFAGASVQARQLTNIAHLNWEMRNVYKQWMFKYYVLGGLALDSVTNGNLGTYMDFTMQSYTRTGGAAAVDKYNFPSVCIDFAGTGGVGLCTKYLVPGLPRFESSNVLGMDETTNAFIDTIVQEKSENCSKRTALNFYTANTWAYNVMTNDTSLSNITTQSPEIAAQFMGAFPAAFELAVRIRNLEYEVNSPPEGNICVNAAVGVDCNKDPSSLNSPAQERALKAWTTGYRNMGKNGNDGQDNTFKQSFTLREVAPTVASIQPQESLSLLLVNSPYEKYYLDLKLMTANYATFYTAFTSGQGTIGVDSSTPTVRAEGQCNATKIGLPVPGYPLGFVKNPDFLTYYAVEGKAKFTGLFNPFTSEIVLSAYAAAKPFGGRIGPAIFDLSDPTYLKSRSDRKSSAFITALDTASFSGTFGTGGVSAGVYEPGMPVPVNAGTGSDKFWMTDESDNVGGWIQGPEIFYGIPNMVWDYPGGSLTNNQDFLAERNVQVIAAKGSGPDPKAGLYNKGMFEQMKQYLVGINTGVVTSDAVSNAILMAKAPTLYDMHNYLVPTPEDSVNAELKVDSWGSITSKKGSLSSEDKNYQVYDLEVYAPLYSNNVLYKNIGEVISAFEGYIARQEAAISKYQSSMNLVAADIYNNNKSGATGQNTGAQAAAALSDLTPAQYAAIGANPDQARDSSNLPSCKSIAGKFLFFYTGNASLVSDTTDCVTPLIELLQTRWNDSSLTGEIYTSEYILPEDKRAEFFTAYKPGAKDGVSPNGRQRNPIGGPEDIMLRNFYSAKLIPFKSVSSSGDGAYAMGKMRIYSEGEAKGSGNAGQNRGAFSNPIDASSTTVDPRQTRH